MKHLERLEIRRILWLLLILLPSLVVGQKYEVYDAKSKLYIADLKCKSGKCGLYSSKAKKWYIPQEYDSLARGFKSHIGFKNGLMTLFGDLKESGYEILAEGLSNFFSMKFGDGGHDIFVKNGKWLLSENQGVAFDSILQRELYYSPYSGATIIAVKDGSYCLYETKSKKLVVLKDVDFLEQIEPFKNFKYRNFYLARTRNGKCGLVALPDMVHSQFIYDTLFHYAAFSEFYGCDLRAGTCDKFMETDLEKTILADKAYSSGRYVNHALNDIKEKMRKNEADRVVTLEEFQAYTYFNSTGILGVKRGSEIMFAPRATEFNIFLEREFIKVLPVGTDSVQVVSGAFKKTYFKEAKLDRQIYDLVRQKGEILSTNSTPNITTYLYDLETFVDINEVMNTWFCEDTMQITLKAMDWTCPLCHGYGVYKGGERVVIEEKEFDRKVLVGQQATTTKGHFEHTSLLDGKTYHSYYTKVENVYEYVKEKEIVHHTVADWLVCPYIDMKQYERLKDNHVTANKYDHVFLLIWDPVAKRYVGHAVN